MVASTAPIMMLGGIARQCGGCAGAQGMVGMMISNVIQGSGRRLSTSSKEKKVKKMKGGEEGGDASKNAWYIKLVDQPPGPR